MPTRRMPPRVRRGLVAAAAVVATVVVAAGADAWLLVHRVPTVVVRTPPKSAGTTYLVLASDSRERLSALAHVVGPGLVLNRSRAPRPGWCPAVRLLA